MPPPSATDVKFYVDQGYLVVRDLLSSSEVDEIRADVVRFARNAYPTEKPLDLPDGASDGDAVRRLLAVHFPHWVSPVVRRTVCHPALSAVLRRVAGAHLPHWDGSVKCMQSMLFVKPPGPHGSAWRQDERSIPTRDRSLVGVWITLDEATEENGCMRVLPGSHRMGYLWPTRDHGRPDEFDFADESYGFNATGEVLIEAEAGSAVLFNGYLLRRSLRNRSSRSQHALVSHYCNAWSPLPWPFPPREIQSAEIPTLDNRCVIPIGTDPYAWKGYVAPPERVFVRPRERGSET